MYEEKKEDTFGKDLSSWTRPHRCGQDQITTICQILHILVLELFFARFRNNSASFCLEKYKNHDKTIKEKLFAHNILILTESIKNIRTQFSDYPVE